MRELLKDPGLYYCIGLLIVFAIFTIWAEFQHKEYLEHKKKTKEAAA